MTEQPDQQEQPQQPQEEPQQPHEEPQQVQEQFQEQVTETPVVSEETPQLPLENEFQQPYENYQEPIETQTEDYVPPKEPENYHHEYHDNPAEPDEGVMDETMLHYVEFIRPFVSFGILQFGKFSRDIFWREI